MYGAARLFAVPSKVTLGGKEYDCKGRLAKFYGEMEAEILRSRPNAMRVASANMDLFAAHPDIQDRLLKQALTVATRWVTRDELNEWLNTMSGTAFALWLSIRHNDETLTPERVSQLLLEDVDASVEKLMREENMLPDEAERAAAERKLREVHDRINEASGTDELGNSTGPPSSRATTGPTSHSPGDDGPVI